MFSGFTDGMQRSFVSGMIEKEYRGKAYGYLNAVIGFGSLFAGIIGGYAWQNLGDTFALLIAGVIIIVGLIIFSFNRMNNTVSIIV